MYVSPLLVATENTNAATENEINRGTRGYQKFPVLFSLGLQLGGEETVFLLNKSCRKRKLDIRPTRFDFGTLCSGLCSEARAEKKARRRVSKIESSASEKPSWTSRKLENEAFRPSILCSKMPKLKFARRWTSRNIFDASKLGKSTRCLPLCSKIAQSRKRCFWSKTKIDGRIQTMDALLTYRFFLGLILEHVVPYNN